MALTQLLGPLRPLLRPVVQRLRRRPQAAPSTPEPPPTVTPEAPAPNAFTRYLVQSDAWANDMFLIDVGASGGIHSRWNIYRPRLRALGFEPLVREVERLNRLEADPKVRYLDGFVGFPGYDELFPPHLRENVLGENPPLYQRTSAQRALDLLRMNYIREKFNASEELVYSSRRLSLDEAVPLSDRSAVDFIKVDTDGFDYEVLLGAQQLLAKGRVLGLSVEVQMHGPVHDHANLFCNIDRLLRGHGYTLFDLETYRYSRGVLPGRFLYTIPAQTVSGQVFWGEALYFRDLAAGDAPGWDSGRLLKLASLMDVFGLPDCAAELLVRFRDRLTDFDTDRGLDLLASQAAGRAVSFEQYNREWEDYARLSF